MESDFKLNRPNQESKRTYDYNVFYQNLKKKPDVRK